MKYVCFSKSTHVANGATIFTDLNQAKLEARNLSLYVVQLTDDYNTANLQSREKLSICTPVGNINDVITSFSISYEDNILTRYRTRKESLGLIALHPDLDVQEMMNVLDDYPSFGTCLDQGNIPLAVTRLAKALADGALNQTQHDIIKSIVETKIS